jgi:hypothetical protein
MVSGITRTKDFPVTREQLHAWQTGTPIQRAIPHLSADDREFLMTGITPEEWAKTFPPDHDELLEDDNE